MIKIRVESSVSQIFNLPTHTFKNIAYVLSYIDQGIYYSTKNYHAARKFLITKEGTFPTGLLDRVTNYLKINEIPYELDNALIRPSLGTLDLSTRVSEPVAYIEQQQAVDLCVADHEGRGVVVMPTGVGKTRVIKDLIQRLQVPTLVVPPSANLKMQLYKYLAQCFGSKEVGFYNKNVGCNKHIMVGNIDGLENGKKFHFKHIQAVLIDEFHHSAAATYRTVNENLWNDIYFKFGFTATNYRNNPMDAILLESVLHKEVFSMEPIEAINKGYIVPIQPLIYKVRNYDLEDTSNYATCYKRFIVENVERNKKIVEVANKMVSQKIPTLILVKQVEHGKLLADKVPGAVFVNGGEESVFNMNMVQKFNDLEVPCLVGTSVIGEGVDTKAAGCVILASGEKAQSRIMQNVGRVIRKFPGKNVGYVVDFHDFGSKIMEKHSKSRYNIYVDQFGCQPLTFE
jgi:DNA repair protein RadD